MLCRGAGGRSKAGFPEHPREVFLTQPPHRLCSIFVPPARYQSPCSLQDKCSARPAARTPIYHHLMCIKARSPLIVKTHKKSCIHHGQQQAGGRWGASGCRGSPLASLPALCQFSPTLSPNKVMSSTEEETETQRVSHEEDAGALCTAQSPRLGSFG